MTRWVKFVLAVLLGLVIGLVYGWVISPVVYTNTSPSTLRGDYRADYVLMAAEIYHADRNLDQAARRLALLGSDSPAEITAQAMQYGLQAGYTPNDLQLLQELNAAFEAWQPGNGAAP